MSSSYAPSSLLRRLTRENKTMGPRLAQLEFQNLSKELDQDDLFDLALDFPNDKMADPLTPPNISMTPFADHLPSLNVTLGRTAWSPDAAALPVVGVLVRNVESSVLRPALKALLRKHYIEPFARYVFLCEVMRPIPFLGRYEFTYEYIGQQKPLEIAQRMRRRYGMVQLRDLTSGQALWKAMSNPSPAGG
ncbi:hypothetical protein [Cognatishimia activa]|uniref:hypothetical protein n=1 Tax=Cognatishimia activa TaxID=1715691 RepID=UPI00222F0936|nr:hypothetical protein [Cognatishimia activa]UZD89581.1 hypothetical protein M0D42_08195 [Cognatishimia activa]